MIQHIDCYHNGTSEFHLYQFMKRERESVKEMRTEERGGLLKCVGWTFRWENEEIIYKNKLVELVEKFACGTLFIKDCFELSSFINKPESIQGSKAII